MLIVLISEGRKVCLLTGDFCPFCSFPEGISIFFSEVRHCVWVLSWDGGSMTIHHTLFILFSVEGSQLFFLPSCIVFFWRMTQAEKFPKHLKSENLCLESMRLMVSRWRDWKRRRRTREGGGEDKRQGGSLNSGSVLPAVWTRPGLLFALQVCHLTTRQAWRSAVVVHILMRLLWGLLGSKSSWNCLFWGQWLTSVAQYKRKFRA